VTIADPRSTYRALPEGYRDNLEYILEAFIVQET
jgi:hypothetical protein